MASIVKSSKGYRAHVFVQGVRDTASFRTKREAEAWAGAREVELRAAPAVPKVQKFSVEEVLNRYAEEVSPTKRGVRWEQIRIGAMLKHPDFPRGPVDEVKPGDVARWRDARLKVVAAGSVIRDMGLLSAAFEHARREWQLLEKNPVRDCKMPRSPDHREVLITRNQIKLMLREMGYRPGRPVRSVSQSVAVCFLVALRTGMRAGELCGLEWNRVFPNYCRLLTTKTVPRDVPLEPKTVRLITLMRGFDEKSVFGLTSQTLDALFRRYRKRAGLDGFTFHDARHTAATRLAQRLHVLDLCRMLGWSSTSQAMTYYNPSASDIAKRLRASGDGSVNQRDRNSPG